MYETRPATASESSTIRYAAIRFDRRSGSHASKTRCPVRRRPMGNRRASAH